MQHHINRVLNIKFCAELFVGSPPKPEECPRNLGAIHALTSFVLIVGALVLPGRANAVGDIYGSGGDIDAMFTIGATVYGPLLTTSGPFAFSSESTSSLADSKRVMAKDDAAAFIASAGAYRGAYLEAVFRELREQQLNGEATNEQGIALWLLQTQP